MIAQLALSLSLLSAATTTLALPTSANPVYGGYLASWTSAAPGGPIADFNELSYFGANTTKDGIVIEGTPGAELKVFQEYAGNTKNKLLSIGGWAGSQYVRLTVISLCARSNPNYQFSSKVKDDPKKLADDIAKLMKDGSGQPVVRQRWLFGIVSWLMTYGSSMESTSTGCGVLDFEHRGS